MGVVMNGAAYHHRLTKFFPGEQKAVLVVKFVGNSIGPTVARYFHILQSLLKSTRGHKCFQTCMAIKRHDVLKAGDRLEVLGRSWSLPYPFLFLCV